MKKYFLILFLSISASIFAQPVPYNVNHKKFPLGQDFRKLLPEEVGTWTRFSFHDYIPGREQGHVFYEKGEKQIDVIFGRATDQQDMTAIWKKMYDEETADREKDIKQKNVASTSTRFVVIDGKKSYLFAWTRNLYYFSIETKEKSDADEFMKSFPW